MKRTILVSSFMISLVSTMAFGQGRPAGVGGRPATPGSSVEHRPTNPGKPESPRSEHATHATPQGVDPKDTHGFRNYGQYVAALHVAENLSIPGGIDALKTLMTGEDAVSLGKAIEQLRPDLNEPAIGVEVKEAEVAAKKAEAEAKKGGKTTD